MPLFVDHAGMNTLINDDIDTSNNIRTINDRLSPFQYSIKASDTSTENPFVSSTSDYNDWPDGAITYSFWVKLEGDSTSTRYVLHGINEYDSDRDSESIRFESNYLRIYIYDQDSSLSYKRYSLPISYADYFGWKHVSITWDGDFSNNNISFYIDGQLAAETPETSSVGSPSGDRRLLSNLTLFDRRTSTLKVYELQGSLSTLCVWNAVLNSSDINQVYNSGTPIQSVSESPSGSNIRGFFKLGNELVETGQATITGSNIPSGSYLESLDAEDNRIYVMDDFNSLTLEQGVVPFIKGVSYVGHVSDSNELVCDQHTQKWSVRIFILEATSSI